MDRHRVRQILSSGMRLRYPRRTEGRMFSGMFWMRSACSNCRLKFEREPGYFVGAMYINYGVIVLIVFGAYFGLDYFTEVSFIANLVLWGTFSALFPVFFFRYSRSLWLNFNYRLNPSNRPDALQK